MAWCFLRAWVIPHRINGETLDRVLRACGLEKRKKGEKDFKVRRRIIRALLDIEGRYRDYDLQSR